MPAAKSIIRKSISALISLKTLTIPAISMLLSAAIATPEAQGLKKTLETHSYNFINIFLTQNHVANIFSSLDSKSNLSIC